jgi:LysM repeat protein
MEPRSSAAARLAAALALVIAALVIVVVVAGVMSGEDSGTHHRKGQQHAQKEKKQQTKAKTYTVELGDTLTAIAHKTGVPVATIVNLNPGVDPQILQAGETLKLR